MDLARILNHSTPSSDSDECQAYQSERPAYIFGEAQRMERSTDTSMTVEAPRTGGSSRLRSEREQRVEMAGRLDDILRRARLSASLGRTFEEFAGDGIEVRKMDLYIDEHLSYPMEGVADNYFAPMAPHAIQEVPVFEVPVDDSMDAEEDEDDSMDTEDMYENEDGDEDIDEDESSTDIWYKIINAASDDGMLPCEPEDDSMDIEDGYENEEEDEDIDEDESSTDIWYSIISAASDDGMSLCEPEQGPATTLPPAIATHNVQSSPTTQDSGFYSMVNSIPCTVYPWAYHVLVADRISNGFIDSERLIKPGSNYLSTLIKDTVWYDPTKQGRKENVFGRYTDPESEITIPTEYTAEHQWFVRNIFSSKEGHPHTMFIIASPPQSTNPDNTFTRGEVTTILAAMSSRHKNGRLNLRENKVMPIMVISIIGHEARILQAHYDGKNVVIRVSPLIDPQEIKGCEEYDLFSRYLASKPIGDTTVMPLRKTSTSQKRSASEAGLDDEISQGAYKRLNTMEWEEALEAREAEYEELWTDEALGYWITCGAVDWRGYVAVLVEHMGMGVQF